MIRLTLLAVTMLVLAGCGGLQKKPTQEPAKVVPTIVFSAKPGVALDKCEDRMAVANSRTDAWKAYAMRLEALLGIHLGIDTQRPADDSH